MHMICKVSLSINSPSLTCTGKWVDKEIFCVPLNSKFPVGKILKVFLGDHSITKWFFREISDYISPLPRGNLIANFPQVMLLLINISFSTYFPAFFSLAILFVCSSTMAVKLVKNLFMFPNISSEFFPWGSPNNV